MYKATLSFTSKNYDIRKNQIIDDSFIEEAGITEAEITEYLEIGYLVEYDGTLEITENGVYDVEDYQSADVDVPSGEPTLQNKSQTIIENTTTTIKADTGYDGLGTVTVTTNVSSYNNAYVNNVVSVEKLNIINNIIELPNLTIGESVTYLDYLFNNASSLVVAPQMDTSHILGFRNMFTNCTSLMEVPQYDTSMISTRYGFAEAFKNCPSLSYGSLNNIMAMCINAHSYNYNKNLQWLGLTQEQANICQTLSNWDAFAQAGWTTGY